MHSRFLHELKMGTFMSVDHSLFSFRVGTLFLALSRSLSPLLPSLLLSFLPSSVKEFL